MYIKFLTFLAFFSLTSIVAYAQDLSRKIPAASQFVVTINNKSIVNNSSPDLLTKALTKLNALEGDAELVEIPIKNLIESDFNLNKHAYIYRTTADSLYYMGYLIPLKAEHQIDRHLFSQFTALPTHNGYERRVSTDGKTHVAWNKESLLILTGDYEDSYFQTQEVAERYGLVLEQYGNSEWFYDESLEAAADSSWWTDQDALAAESLLQSAIEEAAAEAAMIDTLFVDHTEEDWDYEEGEYEIDSAAQLEVTEEWDCDSEYFEDYELETDSIYLMNQAREAKNDSIKNNLFVGWLAADFEGYLNPKKNLSNQKAINLKDEKILVRLWVPNMDDLYQDALSISLMQIAYGFDRGNQRYGYEDDTFDLIQDHHTLKIAANIHVDKDMNNIIDALYKNKFNKKFTKYVPENYLAYASLNISMEGYLQQLPTLISHLYAPMVTTEYADILEIATTALEVGLDEKAIGKVMKGDNLFFLNDLHKVSKEYIDYEYDENYDYTEVVKTKEEYAPNFLWMFTSEDQRIFKKVIEFAMKKERVTFEDAIYTLADSDATQAIYILFKENIVFVGTDYNQIVSIRENRFKTARDASVKKDMLSHPFNLAINTSAIPDVVDRLEIPVTTSFKQTLKDLSAFGNLNLKSTIIKNKGFYSEVSVELPKTDKNALQYTLNQLLGGLSIQDED